MISMTARHPQLSEWPGMSPCQEPDAVGQLPTGPPLSDVPMCSEIKLEQLAQQARKLAYSHQLAARHGRDRLLVRLADNERVLQEAHHRLMRAAAERRTIPPAGLWLMENFRLIKELMRSMRRDLRKGLRRELPHLCAAAGECLPRAYDLAWELITHLDAQLDQESLHQFFSPTKPWRR